MREVLAALIGEAILAHSALLDLSERCGKLTVPTILNRGVLQSSDIGPHGLSALELEALNLLEVNLELGVVR